MRTMFVGFVLVACAAGLWGDPPRKAAPQTPGAAEAKAPEQKPAAAARGYVYDVGVYMWPGGPAMVSAQVCEEKNGTGDRVHVTSSEHRLQTALESAAARKVLVEVMYHVEVTPEGVEQRIVRQVRMLDLPEQQPKPGK